MGENMRNLLFIAGILAFVLVLGMAVVGCDDDQGEETIVYDPEDIPNVLKMNDGTDITTAGQWPARRAELRTIMQDNSYGQWRSGETVDYEITTKTVNFTLEGVSYEFNYDVLRVKVSHGGKNVQFDAYYELPAGTPPAGGWPVIVAFGALDAADSMMGSKGDPHQYSLDKGYANIAVQTANIASDNNNHTGAFYTLYPYGATADSQTGVLMAWAWGASKVLDALEAGAAAELSINANNTIVTGTSRNGKAAAVAGAFEERFKITVPVSSGAGGAAIYRYKSNGQTYDLSGYFKYNGGGKWTVDANNPQSLSSIQSDSDGGWFNARFKTFRDPASLPFDQHFLLSLCADTNRYLFMVNGFEWDKWTNPPGFFWNFELTKTVFDLLGVPQNIAVSMHRERHGMEQEDMVKLVKYANYVFYGIQDLIFEYAETGKPKPKTWEGFMSDLHKTPFSKSVSSKNNKTYESGKPRVKK
jgi:hypothetical protein